MRTNLTTRQTGDRCEPIFNRKSAAAAALLFVKNKGFGIRSPGKAFALLLCLCGFLLVAGCATPAQTAGLAVGGVVVAGAQAPTHEIEQIYYLGVFDPQEQLPPTIYRLTVRGQSSFLNTTHFASGWVPAAVIDSLGSQISVDANANSAPSITAAASAYESKLKLGRRLVMFGPEGFREAPKDHRLVIVMGADPSRFFDAVDQTLGDISSVKLERNNSQIRDQLFVAYQTVRSSTDNLNQLRLDVADEVPKQYGK